MYVCVWSVFVFVHVYVLVFVYVYVSGSVSVSVSMYVYVFDTCAMHFNRSQLILCRRHQQCPNATALCVDTLYAVADGLLNPYT